MSKSDELNKELAKVGLAKAGFATTAEMIDRQWERIQLLERLAGWLLSDDTGSSSKFMAAKALGVMPRRGWISYPSDVYDFGRCVELLRKVPIDREVVRGTHPIWDFLLDNWDEAEGYYQKDKDYHGFREMMERANEDSTVDT